MVPGRSWVGRMPTCHFAFAFHPPDMFTSRPCSSMCEAAAGAARISRMVYGGALTDAGAPR
jgi:hypothetical protein